MPFEDFLRVIQGWHVPSTHGLAQFSAVCPDGLGAVAARLWLNSRLCFKLFTLGLTCSIRVNPMLKNNSVHFSEFRASSARIK